MKECPYCRKVACVCEKPAHVPDRLAALEQRVGALVEALLGCFGPDGADSYGDMATRLAALRAPGVEQRKRDAENAGGTVLNQLLLDNGGVPGDTHAEAVRRILADLATARRERDEAVESAALIADRVARENSALARQMGDRDLLAAEERHRAIATAMTEVAAQIRARALVAGQGEAADAWPPVCDRCHKPLTEPGSIVLHPPRNGQARKEHVCAPCFAARDAEIAALRAPLAEAQGEVVAERSKRVAAEHAAADTVDAMLRVERDCDALRARIAELEAREKGARWLLATAHITKSLTPPEWHSKREAWLAGGHAAPIPDPARGLIERAAKVLETYVPLSEDELIADLRAYLGGG